MGGTPERLPFCGIVRDGAGSIRDSPRVVGQPVEERLLAGSRWVDLGIVFPSTIGTIADSANVTHAFHDARREGGCGEPD